MQLAEQLLVLVFVGAAGPQRLDVIDQPARTRAACANALLAQPHIPALNLLAILNPGPPALALDPIWLRLQDW
jgi:hypothetical protein